MEKKYFIREFVFGSPNYKDVELVKFIENDNEIIFLPKNKLEDEQIFRGEKNVED